MLEKPDMCWAIPWKLLLKQHEALFLISNNFDYNKIEWYIRGFGDDNLSPSLFIVYGLLFLVLPSS